MDMAFPGKTHELAKLEFLFVINTEGQVHTWKNLISTLIMAGYSVLVRARNYGYTLELLDGEGIEYTAFEPFACRYLKPLELVKQLHFITAKKRKPDHIIGFGLDVCLMARIIRRRSLVFTDSEPVGVQNLLLKVFSDVILTPEKFKINFGRGQVRINSYKELAYLHQENFSPDPSIFSELGLEANENYVVLRFNAFDAAHDAGRNGFSLQDKYTLVRELEPYTRVYISSETDLPGDLRKYILPTVASRIHHVLNYAGLLITDTGTMATEAAVLGTPVILYLSNSLSFGNFTELENEYGLLVNASSPEEVLSEAIHLIKLNNSKSERSQKRSTLLRSKANFTDIILDYLFTNIIKASANKHAS